MTEIRAWPVIAALLFAAIFQACLVSSDAPDCSASTCDQCIARSGCGWCAASSQCVPGTSLGASAADACGSSDWHFGSCTAGDGPTNTGGCGSHTTCDSCASATGCGWCGATNTCVAGSAAGPTDGTCARAWAGTDSACFESACRALTTCDTCLQRSPCTWCDVEGGICTESSNCPSHYWYLSGNTCPRANQCSSHTSCSSCLAESACGWCADNRECVAEYAGEPVAHFYCSDLRTDVNACP